MNSNTCSFVSNDIPLVVPDVVVNVSKPVAPRAIAVSKQFDTETEDEFKELDGLTMYDQLLSTVGRGVQCNDCAQKEAELYKDSSTLKLRRVIFIYKFLSLSNSRNSNFIITLLCILIPYLIFVKFSLFTLTLALLFHYLVFWKYMYEKKNSKLVSDKDKEEIDGIVKILVGDLENRKNKKPL
jgi:hypothetical protein